MAGVKQLKIDVNELTIGMFVSGLDRPWTQTPFPLQGFYIRDREEIKELRIHCNHVYIDVVKGSGPVKTDLKKLAKAPVSKKNVRADSRARVTDVTPIRVRRDVYTDVAPIEKEIGQAKALHQQVYRAVGTVLSQINVDGQHVPIKETKRAASAMVDSVVRNPDAFTWLSKVKEKDEYTYSHAVRSAVWAILFGRHIGLPKPELDVLAMGVLLKDIGKTRLSRRLLENTKRSPDDQSSYEKFVEYGVEILKELPEVKPRVISVIKTHCERVNGSGFPAHLRADKIPLLGKIAGIVTYYDETTNPRNANPLSPSKAVSMLYDVRGIEFQEDLVVEFIRAIGLYPTGTLVELSTGEVGVVVEQNFERRLKPKVVVVLDATKEELRAPVLIDLAEDDKAKRAKIDSGKAVAGELEFIEIAQDLKPGTYNIDITDIRDDYIDRKSAKGLLARLKNKFL
ncbi:HD-GYP domain-containing protein [Agaribacterium haliotis]|uniref:HD-GYP domain-containing protein n=1 Tax=Agaribacterium haliotis TaxID=2013869 RepID=UPI0023D80351|nr:HD-GYP domain-containing protein [Agaribacterium haliotis]